MSQKALERALGPNWRKRLDEIRWEAQHSASERHKRSNTKPPGKVK